MNIRPHNLVCFRNKWEKKGQMASLINLKQAFGFFLNVYMKSSCKIFKSIKSHLYFG